MRHGLAHRPGARRPATICPTERECLLRLSTLAFRLVMAWSRSSSIWATAASVATNTESLIPMPSDPPLTPRGTRRPLALAVSAVLAAASVFLLPAADTALPGGALAWQLLALGVAVGGAWWGYRSTRTPAAGAGTRRSVRLLAGLAVLLALLWIGGVAVLWFLWPR